MDEKVPQQNQEALGKLVAKLDLFDEAAKMAALKGLPGLDAATKVHYAAAVHTGVHAFIEFAGLMSVFVDMCKAAQKRGQDFTYANGHADAPLPLEVHQAQYLAEKMNCIFGPSLRANQKAAEMFVQTLFRETP